ncbi:MAG: adenylate/guanylate cyclase domain-containing protein, partial [Salinisphaeraceae bacterium]|nr:adenylate/guanylate cyclase domain-containing protein [Salinisphaeraceae bacterium]
ENELRNIHLIGSYRDEEVDSEHPLSQMLAGLRQQGRGYTKLKLTPLQLDDIGELLSDSLAQPADECRPLAQWLLDRCSGNPFFIRQMLQHLCKHELLVFKPQLGSWHWSIEAISQADYSQEVAQFIAGQLETLKPQAQTLLQTAACIGSKFQLDVLAQAHGLNQAEAIIGLYPALNKGLIRLIGIDSKLLLTENKSHLEQLLEQHSVSLQFNHDTITQAANQRLTEAQRSATHLRIARLLEKHIEQQSSTSTEPADSHSLFKLASHYNLASEQLNDQERLAVAKLNLKASSAVQQTGGYEVALGLSKKALSLLPDDAWQTHYRLNLDLHHKAAELACLTAEYASMHGLLEAANAHAQSPLDRLPGYETKILSEIAQNRPYQAVKAVIPMLAEYGLQLPARPRPKHVVQSYLSTRLLLAGRSVNKLQQLPPLQDPTYKAGLQLLSRVISAAYFSSALMLPLIILLLVRISVRQGLSALSPVGFVGFGALICGAGNKTKLGLAYGELGLQLARDKAYDAFANRAQFLFGHYIEHWNAPLENTCITLNTAFESSLRQGDQEFTAYPAALYCMHAWFAGKPLPALQNDMRDFGAAINKSQHETAQRWHEIYSTAVTILADSESDPLRLQTEHFDEDIIKTLTPSSRDAGVGFHYRLNKLILCYLFGDLEQADFYRRKAAIDLPYLIATPYIPVYHQYNALVCLARYRQQPDARLLRKAHRSLRLMRSWATNCPANFEHKAWLLEAEMACCHNHQQDAITAYEKAVAGAQQQGFHQDAAIALERAGDYALTTGRETQGLYYLAEAIKAYQQWGAVRKVVDIRARHPLLEEQTHAGSGYDPAQIDVATVIKSSQALAGEIVLPRLVQKLMSLVMENSGAERAALITCDENGLQLTADCQAEKPDEALSRPIALESCALAHSVLQYVARTQEPVILKDAQREGSFRNDSYIRSESCRSLLCLPLLNQGKLSGLLYLENKLIRGAFTPARQEMLTVLCSQAAVSLENARLYENISKLNTAYERFVPHDMLKLLQRDSIVDVRLGDQIEGPMTALFTDIRGFTRLSERMSPEENFAFLNEYLAQMAPIIRRHGGFINRYLGDALLAIFPGKADSAVAAAVEMLDQLANFNEQMQDRLDEPLRIGIGINTGPMMLGTVGEPDRMEGSILSDAVNVAARLENLTKTYKTPLIISASTQAALENGHQWRIRHLDKVQLRGRQEAVEIYAVVDTLETQNLLESSQNQPATKH